MALSRRGHDPWSKEVHFFDQWPAGTSKEYLACFPMKVRGSALAGKPHVLMDASPEYLLTPAAAPRIQAIAPQARFVVILRVCYRPRHCTLPGVHACMPYRRCFPSTEHERVAEFAARAWCSLQARARTETLGATCMHATCHVRMLEDVYRMPMRQLLLGLLMGTLSESI